MPKKLRNTGKLDLSSLSPKEVKPSTVIERGDKFLGKFSDLEDFSLSCESCQTCQGCESCQTCQGCESCQKSDINLEMSSFLKESKINKSSVGPMKVAREVVYEIDQKSDKTKVEHGK